MGVAVTGFEPNHGLVFAHSTFPVRFHAQRVGEKFMGMGGIRIQA